MDGHTRRLARGGAATALATLIAAAPAGASLGGTPAHFAKRPNLRSVTFNGQVASFNFDRPVQPSSAFSPGAFQIGDYRPAATAPGAVTANVSVADPASVLVTFAPSADAPDLSSRTFGAVEAGAVQGAGSFAPPNLADATQITGATGASGTRGSTTGPDLRSVAVDADNQRIAYVFDQAVSRVLAPPPANAFRFVDASGTVWTATDVVEVGGSTVVAQFAHDVGAARQAMAMGGMIAAAGTLDTTPATMNVNVPGKSPLTVGPTLTSATLEPNSGTIVYVFDRPVGIARADRFSAVTSTGQAAPGVTATVLPSDPRQVRVTLGTSQFTEHIVVAAAGAGAVTSTSGEDNRAGGQPVGANSGAAATGYTSAPDAIAATTNVAAGQITVTFDSRVVPALVDPSQFVALADDGTPLGGPRGLVTVETSSRPGPATVVLQFAPEQLELTAAVRVGGHRVQGGMWDVLGGHAVTGTAPGPVADAQDVQAILVPVATTQVYSRR